MNNLTILIKPASSSCNMRCRYCFYHDVSQHRQIANMGLMRKKTMKILIEQALAEIHAGGQLNFVFQGGEPTLCGKKFYECFVAYAKEVSYSKSCTITYALQTNGLLLDEEFCEFLAKNSFLIGLSLDGMAETNDYNRIDSHGKGTFNRVEKTIQRLRKFGVEFNILSVITKRQVHHAEKLYKFYERQRFTHVQLIPCINGFDAAENSEIPQPQEYGQFLCRMFELWVQGWEQGNSISIREFENFFVMVMYQQEPELCSMRGSCSISPVVEADGSIYPCDFYVLDEWILGNIYDSSMKEFLINDKAKKFIQRSQQLPGKCKKCQWLQWCRAGCRRMWEPWTAKNPAIPAWCAAQNVFIPFALELLPRLAATQQ